MSIENLIKAAFNRGRRTRQALEQDPPPLGGHIRRLREPACLISLILALVLGILIGDATRGGSVAATPAPGPIPAPSLVEARAMRSAADEFTRSLVTFDGSLSGYEQSLDATSTAALASRLPVLLNLTPRGSGGRTSTGAVIFTAPATASDTLYVAASQHTAIGGKPQGYHFFLVLLTMTRARTGWRVSGISFKPTASSPLP